MKKAIWILLFALLLCLAACGAAKLDDPTYNAFFSHEALAAYHVEGLPQPNVQNSVRVGDQTIYLNLTGEEIATYTKAVAEYILSRSDVYYKGVFYEDRVAVGPLFFPLNEQVYVPFEMNADLTLTGNRFAFALESELGNGWLQHSMREAFEVSIQPTEGVLEEINFSYNAVLEIGAVKFARYETCAKEHKYGERLSYPVPNTEIVIHIAHCVYCNAEQRSEHYGDYQTKYAKTIVDGVGYVESTCYSEYLINPTCYAGLEEHVVLRRNDDVIYTVAVNGFELPLLYKNEHELVYGFIMPQCDASIVITAQDVLDKGLVFEENEQGAYTVVDYTGTAKNLTIPAVYNGKSVTAIGGYAFADCVTLERVVISGCVTVIEMGAFARCSALKEITLSPSVIELGVSAFLDCTSLTSIVLPVSVKAVAPQCFKGCTALTSVVFPYADKKCWLSNTDMWSSTGKMVGGSQYDASDPQKNAAKLTSWPYNAIYYYAK